MGVLVGCGLLGHVHVGGEIRGVHLLQGAHGTLNGPSGVQPEPHPHLLIHKIIIIIIIIIHQIIKRNRRRRAARTPSAP